MKSFNRIAACTVAALALSGCQSFLGALNFGNQNKGVQHASADTGAVFGSDELEAGRAALKAGHVGVAIEQLRLAALNEETAPDAFNALGVAYAKLGRADLSERYFKMALALDSANPKFAANLQRFYNSPLGNSARALAMRQKEADAMLASAEQAAAAQGLTEAAAQSETRGALTLVKPGVTMTRMTNREISIATRGGDNVTEARGGMPTVAIRNPAKPAPAALQESAEPVEAKAEIEAAAAKRSVKQISMLGASGGSTSYPVRISMVKPSTSRATTARARGSAYPLRIAINSAATGE